MNVSRMNHLNDLKNKSVFLFILFFQVMLSETSQLSLSKREKG